MNSRKIKDKLEYIVLHHSCIPVRYSDDTHLTILQKEVQSLYPAYDFGGLYHYVILPSGKVYNLVPAGIYAPHCGLNSGEWRITNDNSISICVSADLSKETMTNEQWEALLNEVKYQSKKHNLQIVRHKDVVATDCPGKNFPYNRLIQEVKMPKLYKDVDESRWSYPAIEYVTRAGIMAGDEKGFRPTEPCTREELAQVILNLQKRD